MNSKKRKVKSIISGIINEHIPDPPNLIGQYQDVILSKIGGTSTVEYISEILSEQILSEITFMEVEDENIK